MEQRSTQEIATEELEVKQPQVYQMLRKAILSEEIKPGERLVERKIATKLGVSRTPVREALRMLETEGLVKHIPRKGVVVTRLSPQEAWEIYQIRSVLEGLAARLAAEWITKEEVEHIENLLEEMEKAVEAKDLVYLNELNNQFNDAIYTAARSPRLKQMISNLYDYIASFARIGYNLPGRIQEVLAEHRGIFEAIKKGDVEEAERLARAHVVRSCECYFVCRALAEEEESREREKRRRRV
ncbi:MAG: GntR family transcriptional regulator [Thermacetogeniaceae bacterium]